MELQVGVKIFLKSKAGKYLVVKRSTGTYPDIEGRWDIVGGRVVPGTSLLDNLRREVHEETQLELTSEPTLEFAQDVLRTTDRHVVRLTYSGETDGEPELDLTENSEHQWLTIAELSALESLDVYVKEFLNSARTELLK